MKPKTNNRFLKAHDLIKKGMGMINKGNLPVSPPKKSKVSNVIKKVLKEKTGGNLLNKLKGK